MRGRPPERLKLKPKAARALQRLVRDGHTPQRVVQRARILLACVQAARLQPVAAKVDQHRTTVWRVCQRYRQAYTMRRAQAGRTFFSKRQRRQMAGLARRRPHPVGWELTRWSARSLALAADRQPEPSQHH